MRYTKQILGAILATAMMMSMAACKPSTPNITVNMTTTPNNVTTTTKAPTTTGVPLELNPITGVADMQGSSYSHPVGVMVANNDFIQSEQLGIGSADMWMEAETEGGITRLMAVFANSERVPDEIGPVRSARTPFVKVAQSFGLGYSHAGGSYTALAYLGASNIADLDVNGGDNGNAYSWRDSSYPHDYEYRLRTSGELLTKYMNDREYSSVATHEIPWKFGEQEGETAEKVSVTISGAQTIGFDYDTEKKVYVKTNGYSETVHKDSAGTAIAPNTVIVLYTEKYMENDVTIDFNYEGGEGYVFSNGKMRTFDWTRDASGFMMTENDGSQLTIGKGKVYLCVVAHEYSSELSYE